MSTERDYVKTKVRKPETERGQRYLKTKAHSDLDMRKPVFGACD